MADTWSISEDVVDGEPATNHGEGSAPAESMRRIVRESLRRELRLRRDRAPHAQLGVVVGADAATIEKAFTRLRAEYGPAAYAAYGPEAAALAREIAALVQAAFIHLGPSSADDRHTLPPLQSGARADETERALETLRGSVERRRNEGLRLAGAGQRVEARRMFESVLLLDPHDDVARVELARLRVTPALFDRVWSWLLAGGRWLARRLALHSG